MRLRIAFVAIALAVTSLYAAALWTIYGQAPPQTVEMIRGVR